MMHIRFEFFANITILSEGAKKIRNQKIIKYGSKKYIHFHCLDKFAASQPLGYESCLDTPQRYLYTKKLSRQNQRHRDGDIEWSGWSKYTNDGIPTSDGTVFTCAGRMRCFLENVQQLQRMIVCVKFLGEHHMFRDTPHNLLNHGGV